MTKKLLFCPNCRAQVNGLQNPVQKERLRWYSSSTKAGCPNCGARLGWDARSKLWLLLILAPLPALLLARPDQPQKAIFYGTVAIAIIGMLAFIRTRKLVAYPRKQE